MADETFLNIVAIPPSQVTSSSKGDPKRKKRLNKYDKRRRKSEQKKQVKAAAKNAVSIVTALPLPVEPVRNELVNTSESLITETDAVTDPHLSFNSAASQDSDNADVPENESTDGSSLENVNNDGYDDEDDGENDEASAPDPFLQEPSITVDRLQDEKDRAKYLAEFHARPLELDRRAGASKHRITKSKDSAHVFAIATSWKDLHIHEKLQCTLSTQFHHDQPTVVQSKSITAFSQTDQRYNLLLQAETGSGKTLAYLLPIVQSMVTDSQGAVQRVDRSTSGTRCIILCPTRELASQTFSMVEQLCTSSFNWIVPGCLFGEERRKSEKSRLRKGLSIIVATPGRFLDHMVRTESLLLSLKGKLEWFVLDEADRLLDMGLGDQVTQIVQRVRANQPGSGVAKNGITWRSVLVSATVTPHVEKLAKETLIGGDNSWVWIQGGDEVITNEKNQPNSTVSESSEFAQSTPHQLTQLNMTVSAKLRLPALVAFLALRAKKQERTVVFLSTCAAVEYYHALFTAMEPILESGDGANGVKSSGLLGTECTVYKLHGSIPHGERQQTLKQFVKVSSAKKQSAVLFATDVASRGLNLPDVDWTAQFDPPGEVAEYVHRAGRAARAGKAGHSLLFLLPSERAFVDILKKRGVKTMSALSLSSTLNAAAEVCKQVTAEGVRRAGGGMMGLKSGATASRSGEAFASEVQRRLEECVLADDAKSRANAKAEKKSKRWSSSSAPVGGSSNGLVEMARNAFVSHIRSYPTKEKLVRHVFSAKALHLGHIARSFALKEPPKKLAIMTSKQTGVVVEKAESRKRNSAMEFGQLDEGHGDTEPAPSKKQKGTIQQRKKALLMSNAAKLQVSGLDGL